MSYREYAIVSSNAYASLVTVEMNACNKVEFTNLSDCFVLLSESYSLVRLI